MNMKQTGPVVLSIAGYDPSSGAGVTADVKTIAAHGCYALTCITSFTVQSTTGVRRVEPLAPAMVAETLTELESDFRIAAVRVGMLGSPGVAEAVAEFLDRAKLANVVLDPILKSSSGADLLEPQGFEVLRSRLLPLSEIITPNIDEAGVLLGRDVSSLDEARAAGRDLLNMGPKAVVVTGGHLPEAVEVLVWRAPGGAVEERLFRSERLKTLSTHGTGCAFASAVGCELALGRELPEAVAGAKEYVRRAIESAEPLGHGNGPLNHFWNL
ncbi:MAG TPA: bifunctional hydroxymethylpyrimidine kinase/phosphomethylpyrimidine kinase [Clostridia bacterium]|nr:bifunctional hydroxymethylpyrimidine kinase/phosphomethylpyrimidine kinase [Clostridia bacterium]